MRIRCGGARINVQGLYLGVDFGDSIPRANAAVEYRVATPIRPVA